MKPSLFAAALAALAPCASSWAQTAPSSVVVTAPAPTTPDAAAPASVLGGDALVLRRGSSLGETLDGLPGVASSYFGPNANRPVIRGQDGDRIRMLSNAGASLDASGLSFDHAVPIDPLVVERLEVLRGPAALLYGGSAIGGVVNAIDNRIPRARLDGISGALETRLGGAARERAVSALVEGGAGALAFHADAFGRRTADLGVPPFDRPRDGGTAERRRHVVNSASRAHGGAIGGSWVGESGHLGASVDHFANDYGIVAEDDVTIRLRRTRLALTGEWRAPGAFFTAVRAQAAGTDYRHQEIEGDGSVGTTFTTRGGDARLEAPHRALALGPGQLEGTWGAQLEDSRFAALGEEAFVPSTRTQQAAAFALERWRWGQAGQVSAGLRVERVRVHSAGDAEAGVAHFGPPRSRAFSPRSASLGALVRLGAGWEFTAGASHTERAPTSYELFAQGEHAATGAYERGDPAQRLERGRNVDLALAWQHGANRARVGLFDSRFARYITLAAVDSADAAVFEYRATRARLWGLEAEGTWRLWSSTAHLDLDARLDLVRGVDLARGEPLPRLAPRRAMLGLSWAEGPWTARAELRHAGDQSRVPATDRPTPGWTMLDLSAHRTLRLGDWDALLFARLHNATDRLGYSAGTIATVRAKVPLPGRSLTLGLRAVF